MHKSTFWLKFDSFKSRTDLEKWVWSPKPNQLFIMSQCYTHANLVEICQPVHEIWHTQAPFGSSSCPIVTSMQVTWNPPTDSWDIMPTRKCHADANTDANRICTKNNVPLPFGGGHNKITNFQVVKKRNRNFISNVSGTHLQLQSTPLVNL